MSIPDRNLRLRASFGDDRHPTLALPTLHFAFFFGDPVAGGAEPTTVGGYARAAKLNDSSLWGVISGTAVSVWNNGTSGDIVFPALTALWSQPELDYWGIFDASSGGTLWYSGPLTQKIYLTGVGEVPRLPAGSLRIDQE